MAAIDGAKSKNVPIDVGVYHGGNGHKGFTEPG